MIKKLAPYTKGYRLLMLFAIACSAGEAVLELTLPQVMSDIVDIGIANGDRGYILMAGLKMVIMALLALGCGVGAAALAAKASMGFGAALRKAEYEQVQRFSFANIERFSTASLVTRLTNDVASVQMTTFMGMRMLVRAPTMLVTALVMALIISQRLSQVFLVVIPLLIIAVVIVIKRVGPFFTSLQGATDQLNLVVQEDLNAIRVVKSFVREAQEKEKFAQRSEKLRSMAERAFGFVVLFMPVMMVLMGGTITAVMWIGGHYVWEGTLLSGDLIAFFTYLSEILMSLMMVSVVLMMLTRAIACGKRIVEVLEEEPRITDKDADPALTVEDGSIRFDLPWKQTEEPSDPSAPDGASRTPDAPDDSPDVIIDEPEPPAKPELTELHGAELSESVLRGSADAALTAVPEGANAVALRVKNARGELLYASALQEAIDVNAVKGGSGANAVIEALTGSEVYTIARINATHDSLYSFAHMADAGVLQLNYAGYIWYDPDSTFYLAPEKPAARQYIVSVARECAELGFDELLFDEFGYPTRGRLNNIDESARTLSKSAALAQLAEELRSGTEAYGVRLSVQLDAATVLAGGNETAGQDLAALAAVFDRIYVETTVEQLPALTAALEPYDAELVPILSEAPASGSYLLTA